MKRTVLLLVVLGLAGCLPIPEVRVDLNVPPPTYRFPLDEVAIEYVRLPGTPAPNTPERFNQTFYLRYFAPEEPTDSVLVLVPGIFGGAATFDILARRLVAAVPGLEVWAVDRRANALEDRTVFLQALEERDPMLAYRYYVEGAKEDGFNAIPPEELRFLAFWGLDVHLRDLHETVERAEEVADTVILGGHSLGASLASLYTAYEFEDGPGYRDIDGLLLLDGTLGRTGALAMADEGLGIGPIRLVANIAALEAGDGDPYLTTVLGPYNYVKAETNALLARLEPEALSPGDFVDYPATNRAVAGITRDTEYGASVVFGTSVGEPVGAEFGGNLSAVIVDGLKGVYSRSVAGVAEGYDFVGWTRGDPAREPTNLDELMRAATLPETNYNEWYFPIRLLLDTVQLDATLADEPGFIANAEVPTPTLAVGAERGLVSSLDGFATYANVRPGAFLTGYILPVFTHIDVVTAEENPVVPLFARWLGRIRE